ncbi:MAG: hypothetical protein MHM6MM_004136, partial [Cercozoa sp. M6MM]
MSFLRRKTRNKLSELLCKAIDRDNDAEFSQLLQGERDEVRRAICFTRAKDGHTALTLACEKGAIKMVQAILIVAPSAVYVRSGPPSLYLPEEHAGTNKHMQIVLLIMEQKQHKPHLAELKIPDESDNEPTPKPLPTPKTPTSIQRMLRKVLKTRKETRDSLRHSGVIQDARLFGVSIEVAHSSGIIRPIWAAMEHLKQSALDEPGLFRKSGDMREVLQTVQALDFPDRHPKLEWNERDCHVIAGVVKRYFRELPEPLIPFDRYDKAMALVRSADLTSTDFTDNPLELNNLRKEILARLLCFLAEVSKHESENLMTAHNLAVVFAPNLMRRKVPCMMSAARDAKECVRLVESMILAYVDHTEETTSATADTAATTVLKSEGPEESSSTSLSKS